MTDNEKRAHDLAIAIIGKAELDESCALDVAAYSLYIGAYNQLLEKFDKAFPNG